MKSTAMEILADLLRAFRLSISALIRRTKLDSELDEEIGFHIEMEAQRLERDGIPPEEARRRALVLFGGVDRFKEQTRDSRGTRWLENTMQDLKYGLRMLTKDPLFTTVAVITLALGIGANTAIYTVVEAVLIQPLPFRDPDRLTELFSRNEEQNQPKSMISPRDFDDWRNLNATFEAMAGYWPTTGTILELDGGPTRTRVVYTTEDFFEVLGASTLLGRTFTPDEGPSSTPVLILDHGFWERRFGADPSIIGKTVNFEGVPVEVVGVLRADQTFPMDADVWTQMTWPMQIQSRASRWMSAIGRLSPGVDLDAARADLETLAARVGEEHPETNKGWGVAVADLKDELVGDTGAALLILLSATGLVLLIACANVANLLLSRSEARSREIAIRTAFGAGRARLVRQLLTESLMLAGAGGMLGIALAWVGVRALLAVGSFTLPREADISIGGTVPVVVLAVTMLTGVLFGLAPIFRLLGSGLRSAITDGTRSTRSIGKHRLQHTFVVTQLGMAVMLVVGAGLLVRSFSNLRAVDVGFEAEDVLTVEIDLSDAVAEDDRTVMDFYERFERRLRDLPEVLAVGDASTLPLGEELDYRRAFDPLDRDIPAEVEPRAWLRPVSPGFFDATRATIRSGRDFTEADRVDAPGALIVNEAMARQFYPGEDPVGKRLGDLRQRWGPLGALHISGDIRQSEIVGVVKDMKYESLRSEPQPTIYISGRQSSIRRRTVFVRSSGDNGALLSAIRQELASMNPSVALAKVQTLSEVVDAARSQDRLSMWLLTLFGVIALTLASVGVYGVLAYAVAQRRQEVGIRMALGADRGDVRGLVLRDGARLIGTGLSLGLLGALTLSGVLANQLFGVSPRDPTVVGTVTGILLAVSLLASVIPAWRATRVDPAVAMRAE